MPELPAVPAVLPGTDIPSCRDVPISWELQLDEMGLPMLAAAAGLVLASLLLPSSAGKMMLQRRGLEMIGSGALLGAGHGLAPGHWWAQGTQRRAGGTRTPTLGTRQSAGVRGEEGCEDAVPPTGARVK